MINLNRVRGYKKSTLGLVLLSFCLVLTNPSKGQWSQVTLDSSLQYFGLNALHFLNEDTGHVVGLNEFFYTGLYMKTTDGGATWSVNAPKYQGEFNDVQFTSVDTGYIVGDNSLLLKSVDGGVNWIEDTTATSGIADINFNDIEFINSQVGYMVGDMGLVLKTTNGGANWNLLRMDTSNKGHHLQKVEFLNEQVGYVAGSIDPEVILLKTINGGATWDTVFQQNEYGVLDFQILNDSVSYFCTYSSLYQTQDNWATFSLVAIDPGAVQVNPQAFYFLDELNGYIFATRDSPKSYVYKTRDGGNNWYRQDVDTLDMFVDFQMINNSVGYAVGYSGKLVKTTNGGGGSCPVADFSVSSDHSCIEPYEFSFQNLSYDSVYGNSTIGDTTLEYYWNFGNGFSSEVVSSIYGYSSVTGVYIDTFEVTLTVTNAIGCQASHMDTVIISNDCVWPGNTDDDPIPNYKDLLPIGLGYGISGVVRVDQATNWDGKLALNWSDTLANGKNLKHA
ncbi:MAG: hypothetical protein JKX95_07575, partial [Bacteroidia bacterium]|nr:hypothetical protein [Bacteroidia bacterium]